MLATMLGEMEKDPTFLIGGEVEAYGTNAACGDGPHYVVEADESDGTFMFLDPTVAIVTNVEADHLDHYGSVDRVIESFREFLRKVPADGMLVACADDPLLLGMARDAEAQLLTYGVGEDADVRYDVCERVASGSAFRVEGPDGQRADGRVAVPGDHMVANATAAVAAALALGYDLEEACAAVSSFRGVKRRFDRLGSVGDVDVVDDYAHHPTEVRATLEAARRVSDGRVWVIFQPHRYSRTEALAPEFADAFEAADRVVMMDVYSAGETPIPGVSGKTLVDAMLDYDGRSRVAYLPHRTDVAPYVGDRVRAGDLVMTMGAGDVTNVGPELVREMTPAAGDPESCR
jgi:UDP-N-acetylmuramate--alanine ligase